MFLVTRNSIEAAKCTVSFNRPTSALGRAQASRHRGVIVEPQLADPS